MSQADNYSIPNEYAGDANLEIVFKCGVDAALSGPSYDNTHGWMLLDERLRAAHQKGVQAVKHP